MTDPDGGYPDLCGRYGWSPGVHRAPAGYQHPWLAVLHGVTYGCWTRRAARGVVACAALLAVLEDVEDVT